MITLYGFGPYFGLPDPSPFVTKAELLLKMARLPYRTDFTGLRKAPKGKLPYIDDDGERIADSTFIRWHLERKHKVDFDRGLDAKERAVAWAFEKMAEDHFYWTLVHERWMDDANFNRGARAFFEAVPAPVRLLVMTMTRRKITNAVRAQGTGRHSRTEIEALGARDIEAIADHLGDKPFFLGTEPCGADATIFAFLAVVLCRHFDTPLRSAAERHDNLKRYVGRMTARYYPELGEIAGCKAAA
jgi:glutathione S-transferase